MAIADSKNVLDDFDFCLALSQIGINSQMATAFKAWEKRKQFSGRLKIFKTKKDGVVKDAKTGIDVRMGAMKIGLNEPDGKLGQVRVTIPLLSGTVTFVDEETLELDTHELEEAWEISFLTDIHQRPVDLKALQVVDPEAAAVAGDALQEMGLSESVFSIEYLFLTFQQVNLLLESNRNQRIPANVPSAASNRAMSALQLFLQGELGEFPLGTVMRRKKEIELPTFALTDFVFSVHPHAQAPKASTLAYLGMLQGRPRPADIDRARNKLSEPWASPELFNASKDSVHGVMLIRRDKFIDEHLMPKFKKALGEAPTGSGMARHFSESNTVTPPDINGITKIRMSFTTGYELTVSVNPGTPTLTLQGHVHSRGDTVELLQAFGNPQTAAFRNAFKVPFDGVLDFEGEGAGTAFGLKADLKLKINFDKPDETLKQQEGSAAFLDLLSKINGKPFSEVLKETARLEAQRFAAMLDRELAGLDATFNETRFIPPGGGVFTFNTPHFSSATGDLVFNVIYQAP